MSGRRILVSQHRLPEFDRERGSLRVLEIMGSMQAGGWEVSFLALDGDADGPYARRLRQAGFPTYVGLDATTEQAIAELRFDVVIVAFWHAAQRLIPALRRLSPATRVIVDSVDLHFLRQTRRGLHLAPSAGGLGLDDGFAGALVAELTAYAEADGVLAVSTKEAAYVDDLLGRPGFASYVPLGDGARRSALPWSERRGLVFVGNFRHLPNIDAVRWLCHDIVPRLDPSLLAEHPLHIVGHAMTDDIRQFGAGLPGVRMTGWVPSVAPYLERARLSLVPLLFGAGVKGKLIQSLMTGTPVVTTTVGVEGIDLADGEHLLVADTPHEFVQAIARLLTDADLWQRLADAGHDRVEQRHGGPAVRAHLTRAVLAVLAEPVPSPAARPQGGDDWMEGSWNTRYRQVQQNLADALVELTPEGATVLVVSEGDDAATALTDRIGLHFPAGDGNHQDGFHPPNAATAIAHLEAQRDRGASFLAIPATARWWLHHYAELALHLGRRHTKVFDEGAGVVYALLPAGDEPTAERTKVLVLGTYRAADLDATTRLVEALSLSPTLSVHQRWAALGAPDLVASARNVHVGHVDGATTDDAAWGELLIDAAAQDGFEAFDYVVAADAAAVMASGALESLVDEQERLGLDLAQPSVRLDSPTPLPCLRRQLGARARHTAAAGRLPLLSIAASALPGVLADAAAGCWHVDGATVRSAGIIDSVSVGWTSPQGGPLDAAIEVEARSHVVAVVAAGDQLVQWVPLPVAEPRISVAIATFDRAELLEACLRSFVDQTLPPADLEIVVVDDGSIDETNDVCDRHASLLPLRHVRIGHAGRSAAKNLAVGLSRAPVVLFFDDDDVADPDLLEQHLLSHAEHPGSEVAVLGHTTWAPGLEITPVMRHVTDVGHFLFSYHNLTDGQVLDFTYFWEGRVSCKRGLLLEHGLHDQRLEYTVDIELGWRLAAVGLQVVFNRKAVSWMARAVDFRALCRRAEAKGRSLARIAQLHPDEPIQRYCDVPGAEALWSQVDSALPGRIEQVIELEAKVAEGDLDPSHEDRAELDDLYRDVFMALRAKGIAEASAERRHGGPELSIVIPVWNITPELAAMTTRTIERLWEVAALEIEVVVIDNGSPHEAAYRATVTQRFEENRGVACAWNAGVALAGAPVLAFVNNDVWVEPGWDLALRDAALDGRRIAFPYTDHGDALGPRQPDQAGTAGWCFAASRALLDEIGSFDEGFSPAFFEDTDYWHRAWEAGVELSPVPAAVVHHARRTTARHDPRHEWLLQGHRYKYGWKHGVDPTAPPPFYLREVVPYVVPPAARPRLHGEA